MSYPPTEINAKVGYAISLCKQLSALRDILPIRKTLNVTTRSGRGPTEVSSRLDWKRMRPLWGITKDITNLSVLNVARIPGSDPPLPEGPTHPTFISMGAPMGSAWLQFCHQRQAYLLPGKCDEEGMANTQRLIEYVIMEFLFCVGKSVSLMVRKLFSNDAFGILGSRFKCEFRKIVI